MYTRERRDLYICEYCVRVRRKCIKKTNKHCICRGGTHLLGVEMVLVVLVQYGEHMALVVT